MELDTKSLKPIITIGSWLLRSFSGPILGQLFGGSVDLLGQVGQRLGLVVLPHVQIGTS